MTLKDIKGLLASGRTPQFEIHAFEGIIYLVKVITEVGESMLKNDQGDNQVFKSSTQAGIALAQVGASEAVVVHQCAYDEVIGHEPCLSDDPSLRTPMDLRLLGNLG